MTFLTERSWRLKRRSQGTMGEAGGTSYDFTCIRSHTDGGGQLSLAGGCCSGGAESHASPGHGQHQSAGAGGHLPRRRRRRPLSLPCHLSTQEGRLRAFLLYFAAAFKE